MATRWSAFERMRCAGRTLALSSAQTVIPVLRNGRSVAADAGPSGDSSEAFVQLVTGGVLIGGGHDLGPGRHRRDCLSDHGQLLASDGTSGAQVARPCAREQLVIAESIDRTFDDDEPAV